MTATPFNGTYDEVITFSARGLPKGATATFDPGSLTPGGKPGTVTLTIKTAKQLALDRMQSAAPVLLGLLLPLLGLRRRGRALQRYCLLLIFAVLSIGAVTGLSGCGSGPGFAGQMPQSYLVTVTASSGTVQRSTTLTLTMK